MSDLRALMLPASVLNIYLLQRVAWQARDITQMVRPTTTKTSTKRAGKRQL